MQWPLDNIRITQGFSAAHQANDLGCPIGTPIKAPQNGVVDGVGNDPNYKGGNYITIKGDNGDRYYMGHNKSNSKKKGDKVKQGEQVAVSGDTAGWKPPGFGPHVHHQVWVNGVLVDPSKYYKNQGGDMAQSELDLVKWKLSESEKALRAREAQADLLNWRLGESESALRRRETQAKEYEKTIADLTDKLANSDGKITKEAVIQYLNSNLK